MFLDRIKTLPQVVVDAVFDPDDIVINRNLRDKFSLADEQMTFLLTLYLEIVVGDKKILDLLDALAHMPDVAGLDLKALALEFALVKLWPLQDYFGNVDILINRLGGIVPAKKIQPKALADTGATAGASSSSAGATYGGAKEILRQNKALSDLYLTQKPLRDEQDMLLAPTVDNWLKDYLHIMGASGSSNLKRSQYLVKSPNAKNLNEAERTNLLNFLLSYEEGLPMHWRPEQDQYLLVEPEMPANAAGSVAAQAQPAAMAAMMEFYSQVQANYQRLFEEKRQGLELEIGGAVNKLTDIMWEALGVGEAERFMAAAYYLMERHMFLDLLKVDQRFRGIVARAIDARYGVQAKNTWDGAMDSIEGQTIFWQLVLVEKLSQDESKAAIIADSFVRHMGFKQQCSYLDVASGKFRFRNLEFKQRRLQFA